MSNLPWRAITAATIVTSALAAAGGSAAAQPAALPAATTASPWSQTNYNAAQSRANVAETILTRAKAGKIVHLRAITIRPAAQSCSQQVDSLALPGGTGYAAGGGFVAKYDAATGRLLWRRSTSDTMQDFNESIAVGNGLVVVGGNQCGSASDPVGIIQAFSATTGKLTWTRNITPLQGALDTLAVSGGLVVSAGDSPGSGPQLSVRRIGTGALAWKLNRDVSCGGQMVVVAQVVITGGSRDCDGDTTPLTGRKLASGAKVWQRTGTWTLQRGDASSLAGRHVFAVGPTSTVVSLNPQTGRTQFALRQATDVLAVDSAQAYAACGSDVCAYGTSSGRMRWKVSVGFTPALAAEADGVLYLDGGVALDTGNGKTLATLWTGRSALSLAISDGRVAAVTAPQFTLSKVIDLYGLKGS